MHPRIAELARELLALTAEQLDRPSRSDRAKLMDVRYKIKDLHREPEIQLSGGDENDRQYLYVEATRAANRQEDFYERNGNKWAE